MPYIQKLETPPAKGISDGYHERIQSLLVNAQAITDELLCFLYQSAECTYAAYDCPKAYISNRVLAVHRALAEACEASHQPKSREAIDELLRMSPKLICNDHEVFKLLSLHNNNFENLGQILLPQHNTEPIVLGAEAGRLLRRLVMGYTPRSEADWPRPQGDVSLPASFNVDDRDDFTKVTTSS